jgi:ribosomal protein L7/L12
LSPQPADGLVLTALVHSQCLLRDAREAAIEADAAVQVAARELAAHEDETARTKLAAARAALAGARRKEQQAEVEHGDPMSDALLEKVAPAVIRLIDRRMKARPDAELGLWGAYLLVRLGEWDAADAAYEGIGRIDMPEARFVSRYGRMAVRLRRGGSVGEAEIKQLGEMADDVPVTQQTVTGGMVRAATAVAQMLAGDEPAARRTVQEAMNHVDPSGGIHRIAKRLGISREAAVVGVNVVLDVAGPRRGDVLEALVAAGLSRQRASEVIDAAPITVWRNLSRERADQVRRALEAAGATVELY